MPRTASDKKLQVEDCLTSIAAINKTDVKNLVSNFGVRTSFAVEAARRRTRACGEEQSLRERVALCANGAC